MAAFLVDEVLERAVQDGRVLVSGDMGFGNLLRYPLGSHAGLVIARFPNEMPSTALVGAIVRALQSVTDDELAGNLVVIEPGQIRLRRKA